jgi:cytochrome b pre-mRNA-processing protein 3|tara:strand:- start:502 stop:975 length:474 start_codon:yes stop_codon:yes gene_type:complete
MNKNFLNIYNNLIKLTRNKLLYRNKLSNESFSDRLIIFLFHFAFFLKIYKNKSNKTEFQNLYDYIFNQIELSIREIGYGDSTVNKKMKEYINLFYKIIDNVELWEKLNFNEKINFFSEFIDTTLENTFYIDYFNKYSIYLTKMSFNYFTKDVISHKF